MDNGDGTVTRQMVGGSYGALGSIDQYTAFIATATADDVKEEIIPEPDPGGPRPGPKLGTSATGNFHSLTVVPGAGINGGDAIEFTIDITNNSSNANAYLTAFNYQTKRRGLADIGILDGFSQDRRDIRLDNSLSPCANLNNEACWNASLGVGHFPNVIGNGLLFGQMVWTNANAGREPFPVDSDQVYVSSTGINPAPFRLESVKKNGPFSPILKGNTNFICIKSGLFDLDPDADAACAGQPAILIDPDGEPVPSNISQRLGLPPGQTQSVRIRMEFGDFRGALLKIVAGTLNPATTAPTYAATQGLARSFDCSDQRELEFCHPNLVGTNIGYLPNTNANWLTPTTLEEIEYVIINQPGDAPTVMNFQQNFGVILRMAGFIPSAEFYAPDPDVDGELAGTPYEGVLIRQQVLGAYTVDTPLPAPAVAPAITSAAVESGDESAAYSYQVTATGNPAPTFSLTQAPAGMTIDPNTGLISWPTPVAGSHNVEVAATNSAGSDTQSFQVNIASTPPLSQPPAITSSPVTSGAEGSAYSYQVTATGNPAPTFSLTQSPTGMTIDPNTGLISWPSPTGGNHAVTVVATNSAGADTQQFQVTISAAPPPPPPPPIVMLDDFNRKNGNLGTKWSGLGLLLGYKIHNQKVNVQLGGPVFWKKGFGKAQEAAITLTKIDPKGGDHGIFLKAEKKLLTTSTILVSYVPKNKQVVVVAKEPKKLPKVVARFNANLKDGDHLGARALDDGKVETYVNNQLLGTANAGSYFKKRSGHIGLWFVAATKAVIDDFNGGNITSGSVMAAAIEPDDLQLIDDFDGFEEAFYADIEEGMAEDETEDGADSEAQNNQLFLPFVSR